MADLRCTYRLMFSETFRFADARALVPYLRDLGDGTTTAVEVTDDGVLLVRGGERVRVRVRGDVENVTDVPHGYENRRGLCGLVRVDLIAPGPELRWSMTSEA